MQPSLTKRFVSLKEQKRVTHYHRMNAITNSYRLGYELGATKGIIKPVAPLVIPPLNPNPAREVPR